MYNLSVPFLSYAMLVELYIYVAMTKNDDKFKINIYTQYDE